MENVLKSKSNYSLFLRLTIGIAIVLATVYAIENGGKGRLLVEDNGNRKDDEIDFELTRRSPKSRKTYDDFVSIAKVDHKRVMGIPWIRLDVPELVDYLPSYLKYKEKLLTPIVDQGTCASCWSISVVQMLADRISVYTGGKVKEALSVQEMISCWDGHGGKACSEGGVPEVAYNYIIENGVGLAVDSPYLQSKTKNIVGCDSSKLRGKRVFVQDNSVRSLCIDPYKYKEESSDYSRVVSENVKNMKLELLINGPFVCTIMVYKNLYDYDGLSIYEGSNDSDFVGGHSVVCVGYCDEGINGVEPGFDTPGGYWVIRNSWSDWPVRSPSSRGYFYIKKGSNVCGIESRASRAFPILSDEVKKKLVKSLDDSRYTSYSSYVDDPDRQLLITRVGRIRELLGKVKGKV